MYPFLLSHLSYVLLYRCHHSIQLCGCSTSPQCYFTFSIPFIFHPISSKSILSSCLPYHTLLSPSYHSTPLLGCLTHLHFTLSFPYPSYPILFHLNPSFPPVSLISPYCSLPITLPHCLAAQPDFHSTLSLHYF